MTDSQSLSPAAEACLCRPYPSSQKGARPFAENVQDLATHELRIEDRDAYCPSTSPRFGQAHRLGEGPRHDLPEADRPAAKDPVDGFDHRIKEEQVATEAVFDGIYAVRRSLRQKGLNAADTVRSYKSISDVERAFRSLKTIDLHVRPIHHDPEGRVRAYIFLCLLAYYVEWHMIEVWRPLLFCDEDQEAKKSRDPVVLAKRSEKALCKAHSTRLEDGTVAHSFQTPLLDISGIVSNVCRIPGAGEEIPTFHMVAQQSSQQQRAYDSLETITV